MANDTILVKFNGTINRPDLERFGYKRIFAKGEKSNSSISFTNASSMTVIVMDSDYNDIETASKNANESYGKNGAFGELYFDLSNWYDITDIWLSRCATADSVIALLSGVFANLKNLTLVHSTAVSFNIRELSVYPLLESININGCVNVTGSFESLLEDMVVGRSSGQLTITSNGVISIHGQETVLGSQYVVAFIANGCTIEYDGNIIATYDGTSWTYNN